MDAAELRALQAPLKDRYREDPASALTPLNATGRIAAPGITFDARCVLPARFAPSPSAPDRITRPAV